MFIRGIQSDDLPQILELYTHLHHTEVPDIDDAITDVWDEILNDPNHHILVAMSDQTIVSTCVLLIVPNLARNHRPYAVIENVVTLPSFRGQGYASKVLAKAKAIAQEHNCYKIMLMTGSKRDSTLEFYRRAGFNSDDKTAFIQRLE